MKRSDVSERRRFPRARHVAVTATVIARSNQTAPFAVENLSAGGARLVGDLALAAGEGIQVLLERAGSQPMALTAKVVRVDRSEETGRQVVGVSFSNLPDPIQDAIQGLVLRALARQRAEAPPTVLVIDDVREVCDVFTRDVEALGYFVVAAQTPLDAIRSLQDPGTKVDAAFVDLCLGRADGLDVIEYLTDEHPSIRRVVMSGTLVAELEPEVSSGRADAFLVKPWSRKTLADALSRST